MFEQFQIFLRNIRGTAQDEAFGPGDPRLAVTALCIQVMESDGIVRQSEQAELKALLGEQYGLDGAALDALIEAGREAGSEAVDYFRFTSELKRHLDEDQRRDLIGLLWTMVYADGERSEMEDHAIWRIADLLGVSSRDRVEERQKAAARSDKAR